jgi:hypothetical protein
MGPQTYDELSLTWSATYEHEVVVDVTLAGCMGEAVHTLEQVTGTGEGTDFVGMFPSGTGAYTMNPTQLIDGEIACAGSVSWEYCTGDRGGDDLTDTRYDYLAALLGQVQGLAMLEPQEGDEGHFAGSATVLHSEMPQDGGTIVLDQTVEWDFTRRR